MDREYLNIKYDRVLEQVQTIIAKVIKDDMRDGGIRIKYYAWTDINFDKGMTETNQFHYVQLIASTDNLFIFA